MQVVRKLILYLETVNSHTNSKDWKLDVDHAVLIYHLIVMEEAGLIKLLHSDQEPYFLRLTWAGHEFADAGRDENVWNTTWRQITETPKSVTFESLNQSLKVTLAKLILG